jgi:hypothetical protein
MDVLFTLMIAFFVAGKILEFLQPLYEKPKRKNEQLLTDDGDVFEVIDAPDARKDVE